MSTFQKYKRKSISEMRPVDTLTDRIDMETNLFAAPEGLVSISSADRKNGSPKKGDMIARNPEDHSDLWLVAEKYFKQNLEPI